MCFLLRNLDFRISWGKCTAENSYTSLNNLKGKRSTHNAFYSNPYQRQYFAFCITITTLIVFRKNQNMYDDAND